MSDGTSNQLRRKANNRFHKVIVSDVKTGISLQLFSSLFLHIKDSRTALLITVTLYGQS